MDVSETLKDYINNELLQGSRKIEWSEEDDIFEKGLVNSMTIIQLIAYIEDHYGIQIPHKDIKSINVSSLKSISAYIEQQEG